jgi:hypothetical protein
MIATRHGKLCFVQMRAQKRAFPAHIALLLPQSSLTMHRVPVVMPLIEPVLALRLQLFCFA